MTSSTLLYLGKASEFALRSTFGASKIISACGDCADSNAAPRGYPEVVPKLSRGYSVIAQSRLFFLSQSELKELKDYFSQPEQKEPKETCCLIVSVIPCHFATQSLILGTKPSPKGGELSFSGRHSCATGMGKSIETRISGAFLEPFRKKKCPKLSLFEVQNLLDR